MTAERNAVKACISQLRRMAEDMLATAAMLENGLPQEDPSRQYTETTTDPNVKR